MLKSVQDILKEIKSQEITFPDRASRNLNISSQDYSAMLSSARPASSMESAALDKALAIVSEINAEF